MARVVLYFVYMCVCVCVFGIYTINLVFIQLHFAVDCWYVFLLLIVFVVVAFYFFVVKF